MVFSAIRSGKTVRAASHAVTPRAVPLGVSGLLLAIAAVLAVMVVAMVAFLSVGA